MLVVLPNEVDGLQEIENQLERYLQPPRGFMENVNVKLPSFLTESEFDLIPVLQKVKLLKLQIESFVLILLLGI